MRWNLVPVGILLGLVGVVRPMGTSTARGPAEAEVSGVEAPDRETHPVLDAPWDPRHVGAVPFESLVLPVRVAVPDSAPAFRADARIHAFLQAYGDLVEDVAYTSDDAVLTLGGRTIHFRDGRMLGGHHLGDAGSYRSFFYRYPLGRLEAPPFTEEETVSSTDVLEALFGRTESEIRRHCDHLTFLGRRLFVNTRTVEPLRAVEAEILAAAEGDPDVARWVRELKIAYSFMDKGIAGSASRSYHAWGLAVDLIPSSYGGKHVYWRWSRVFDRDGWHRIPMKARWSPPLAVVEAFERHGFVWGGKWARFDTIHFEYRPEILLYNRLLGA